MTTPEQKAAEAKYEEIQSVLLPEAEYHYNAMKALSTIAADGVTAEDRTAIIGVSIAWALLGILRAKVREAT